MSFYIGRDGRLYGKVNPASFSMIAGPVSKKDALKHGVEIMEAIVGAHAGGGDVEDYEADRGV